MCWFETIILFFMRLLWQTYRTRIVYTISLILTCFCALCFCVVIIKNSLCIRNHSLPAFPSKLCHCCGGNGIVAPMQWRNNPQEIATWWRHQRETFSALLAICAGNSPVTVEFPAQRPVTRSFEVFFDLHRNNRSSKPSWASVLRRPLAHYDATVMEAHQSCINNS